MKAREIGAILKNHRIASVNDGERILVGPADANGWRSVEIYDGNTRVAVAWMVPIYGLIVDRIPVCY